jgi:hypothetical protein
MTSGFVPYTPDVEVVEPRFDENIKTVIDKTEDYVARSVHRAPAGPSATHMPRGTASSGERSRSWTGSRPSTRRASMPHPDGTVR